MNDTVRIPNSFDIVGLEIMLFSLILISGSVIIIIPSYAEHLSSKNTELPSPLKQIKSGIEPQDIKCAPDKVLFFKMYDKQPVCIYEKSYKKLSSYIWIADLVFFNY